LPVDNTLGLEFAFAPRHDPLAAPPSATVLSGTELSLHGIPHFAELPRLDPLLAAGYPLTRYADLGQTAISVPFQASNEYLSLLLSLSAFLGSQTGYPATRVVVFESGQKPPEGRDVVVIGTPSNQELFSRWRISREQLRAFPERADWQRWLTGLLPGVPPETAYAPGPPRLTGKPDALIEELRRPGEPGRTVIVIEPLSDLASATALFRSRDLAAAWGSNAIYLSAGLVIPAAPSSDSYFVGRLSKLQAAWFWLGRYFWTMPAAAALCALFFALQLHPWIEHRAQKRLDVEC
jgi:hypothetical protein